MEAANHSTRPEAAVAYIPGRTLGRSGYEPGPTDRLHTRANQLDALLCLITLGSDSKGFFNCNNDIQRTLLELASSLATDINEIQEELLMARLALRDVTRAATPT